MRVDSGTKDWDVVNLSRVYVLILLTFWGMAPKLIAERQH